MARRAPRVCGHAPLRAGRAGCLRSIWQPGRCGAATPRRLTKGDAQVARHYSEVDQLCGHPDGPQGFAVLPQVLPAPTQRRAAASAGQPAGTCRQPGAQTAGQRHGRGTRMGSDSLCGGRGAAGAAGPCLGAGCGPACGLAWLARGGSPVLDQGGCHWPLLHHPLHQIQCWEVEEGMAAGWHAFAEAPSGCHPWEPRPPPRERHTAAVSRAARRRRPRGVCGQPQCRAAVCTDGGGLRWGGGAGSCGALTGWPGR